MINPQSIAYIVCPKLPICIHFQPAQISLMIFQYKQISIVVCCCLRPNKTNRKRFKTCNTQTHTHTLHNSPLFRYRDKRCKEEEKRKNPTNITNAFPPICTSLHRFANNQAITHGTPPPPSETRTHASEHTVRRSPSPSPSPPPSRPTSRARAAGH